MAKITDKDLKAVITALEGELEAAFQGAKAQSLAKAEGEDKEPPAEGSESPSPAADSAPDASAPPDAPPAGGDTPPAGPPADASAPPAPDASAAAPGAPGQPSGDPAADALTPEALQAEYSQLPPDQLDMHIQAALAAKQALAGAAAPGAPAPAGAPPTAPVGAPGGSPTAGPGMPPPAMKSEGAGGVPTTHEQANGGMAKAELDGINAKFAVLTKAIAEKDALLKAQAEDVEVLSKAVKMVVERPERKAVTGISWLKKAEEPAPAPKTQFTPEEARRMLNDLIPSLSKSERQLVLDYNAKKIGLDKLAPILDKVK